MKIVINPKILRHINDQQLYAYMGHTLLGLRFGNNIHVAKIYKKFLFLYFVGNTFSENMDFYEKP